MSRPRTVFFGTPAFAVPSLVALTEIADVVAVVCQPDKPAGRGNVVTPPPVKVAALERGIEVRQPVKLRDGTVAEWLRSLALDVAIVVAYGRILPPDVLTAPRLGCLNVHASILPRHRGAAPINWAILAGDPETGVTLMQMDEGLDTGPALAVMRTPIDLNETSIDLNERLSTMGAELVRSQLPLYVEGELKPVPQEAAFATLAPLLTRELGKIDWTMTARQVHDRVRGLQPWPGCSTTLGTRRLIVCSTRLDDAPHVHGGAPGEVVAVTKDRVWVATAQGLVAVTKDRVWVATAQGLVALTELQHEGRKRMSAKEFLAGHPLRVGTLLGQELSA